MYNFKTFMILDCNNEVDIYLLLLEKTTVAKWCTNILKTLFKLILDF